MPQTLYSQDTAHHGTASTLAGGRAVPPRGNVRTRVPERTRLTRVSPRLLQTAVSAGRYLLTASPHNRDHPTTGGSNSTQRAKRSRGHVGMHIPPKSEDFLRQEQITVEITPNSSPYATRLGTCLYRLCMLLTYEQHNAVHGGSHLLAGPQELQSYRATVSPGHAGHRLAGLCDPYQI